MPDVFFHLDKKFPALKNQRGELRWIAEIAVEKL
jgi:hypothetical protein